jgi:hypothetical protein
MILAYACAMTIHAFYPENVQSYSSFFHSGEIDENSKSDTGERKPSGDLARGHLQTNFACSTPLLCLGVLDHDIKRGRGYLCMKVARRCP